MLVLGVWSPLRQTGMGNSPQQFEAVETSCYPWVNVTVEGELRGLLVGLLDSHTEMTYFGWECKWVSGYCVQNITYIGVFHYFW